MTGHLAICVETTILHNNLLSVNAASKTQIMMASVASVFFHRFTLQLRGVIMSHGSIARIKMLFYWALVNIRVEYLIHAFATKLLLISVFSTSDCCYGRFAINQSFILCRSKSRSDYIRVIKNF